MLTVLLGPPGTGKTETCLRTVEEYLEKGVPPDRIGYFSFTRRATIEARKRAMEKFNLQEKQLPFFKTLHSMAFSRIGIEANSLMQKEDYQDLAARLKLGTLTLQKFGNNQDYGMGDKFLELIHMSRTTLTPLRDIHSHSSVLYSLRWSELEYFARELQEYKRVYMKHDYTDLLEAFVTRELAPNLEVMIVDEAQDLSALQWQMVKLMARSTPHVFVAGDDDQAIYRWAGADVSQFIQMDGRVRVLDQSYRIPRRHHALSQNLVQQIMFRRPKEFKPRDESGIIDWHWSSAGIDMSQGEWLLLGRTKRTARRLADEVRQKGHLYRYSEDVDNDSKGYEAVLLWERLRAGESLQYEDIRKVYAHMLTGKEIEKKHHNLKTMHPMATYDIHELVKNFGLRTNAPWKHALGKILPEERSYIEVCMLRKEDPTVKPRITVSTIHGAKGAQADNVLLATDAMQHHTMKWCMEEEDDERRVFYVGLTRAKEALHLIHGLKKGYQLPAGGLA